MDKKQEKRLNVRMKYDRYELVRLLADRKGMTISDYIKWLIARDAKRKGMRVYAD